MSRPMFALIWVLITLLILGAMWWGWRSRSRRDSAVLGATTPPAGEIVEQFVDTFYVSTNAVDSPLTRIAAPTLKYRGYADVTVRRDGITIVIRGADPLHIAAENVKGSGSAAARPGKAVERDGLALIRWDHEDQHLESSFRLTDRDEHKRFMRAVDAISAPATIHQQQEHEEHAQ